MARNRQLALEARRILCDALDAMPPAPEEMVGALAAVPLPDGADAPLRSPLYVDPLQDVLLERYRIEVPIVPWPAPPKRLVRVSCQAYNAHDDYERLATGLRAAAARPASAPHASGASPSWPAKRSAALAASRLRAVTSSSARPASGPVLAAGGGCSPGGGVASSTSTPRVPFGWRKQIMPAR